MADIGQTDFNVKPDVNLAAIASLYQKKATDEQMMKLQQSEMETQQQSRTLNVIKMAKDLTDNMIQSHAIQQQKNAQDTLAGLLGAQATPVQSQLPIGVQGPLSQPVPFSQTPEYKAALQSNLLKANPQAVTESLAVQAFPKPPTTTDQLLAASLMSGNQEMTKQVEQAKHPLQPKPFVNLEGKTVMITPDAQGKFNVPEGYIDPTIARAKVFAQPREEANVIRKEQFTEGQWNKLEKSVNALDKGARSSVGMAAVGNQRAARALAVLDDPNMDPIRLKFVMADLAGIMQGGAPHEIMIKQAGYDNVVTKFANLKQQITANPQAVAIPEIREQLKNTIQEIMSVDNNILDTNVGIAKEGFLKAIESDPKRFARMTKALDVVKTVGAKPKAESNNDPLGIR